MDRLHAVTVAAALALGAGIGCKKTSQSEKPPASRVNSVAAKPEKKTTVEELCDAQPSGIRFAWPELAGETPAAPEGWRWVNVWATWCKPCVEEIPRLERWSEEINERGVELDLVFLSIDESDEAVADYRSRHEEIPTGPRIADQEQVKGWVVSLGLDSGATIPIHVFVDPEGSIRCARTGSVGRSDYAAVETLLGL